MAQIDEDGTIHYRVRIWGHYKGKPFVFTDPPDSQGSQCYSIRDDDSWDWYDDDDWEGDGTLYPLKYLWREGNMSCDCNRSRFVGLDLDCGDDIYIDFIQPLEPGLTTLCLMESVAGVIDDYLSDERRAIFEKALEGAHVIEPRDPYWGLGVK